VLCFSKHVAGGYLGYTERFLEQACLRSFTRTGGAQHHDAHRATYRLPRMRPRFMKPS